MQLHSPMSMVSSLQTLLQRGDSAASTWPMQTAGLLASMLKWFSSSSSCSLFPTPTCTRLLEVSSLSAS